MLRRLAFPFRSRLGRPAGVARAFCRDTRGATAIEFAFVVGPFFAFVLLIMQVGLYHFGLQSLDFATRQAGRKVMTGGVPTTITSASQFKSTLICPQVFFNIKCADVVVNAYRVGKSSDSGAATGIYAFIDAQKKQMNAPQGDPVQQKFCLGAPGDYIFLDVAYPYASFVGKLFGASNTPWVMRSTTFVFNEPYKTASASGSC